MTSRPPLAPSLSGAEFRRWYWTVAELAPFARELGLRSSGGKEALTERIAAALDGLMPPTDAPTTRTTDGLGGVLTGATCIPAGQRATQQLRAWFVERVGARFRFDGPMRAYLADSDGSRTLDDAVEHWHTTRARGAEPIAAQFEFNRFARTWHERHPTAPREEMLDAWITHRSSPVDER